MAAQLNPGTLKRIHEIMARAFGPTHAQEAVEIWQKHYAHLESFGVVNFVKEQGERFGVTEAGQQRQLRLALFQVLLVQQPSGAAGQSSRSDQGQASRATTASAKSEAKDADEARAHVAGAILQKLGKASRGSGEQFQEVLAEEIEKAKLPTELAHALRTWDAASDPALPSADAAKLRAAVTAAYIALCEDLGPAGADRALKQARQSAEELDEADLASPSEVL